MQADATNGIVHLNVTAPRVGKTNLLYNFIKTLLIGASSVLSL
jgi:hypothetical protein